MTCTVIYIIYISSSIQYHLFHHHVKEKSFWCKIDWLKIHWYKNYPTNWLGKERKIVRPILCLCTRTHQTDRPSRWSSLGSSTRRETACPIQLTHRKFNLCPYKSEPSEARRDLTLRFIIFHLTAGWLTYSIEWQIPTDTRGQPPPPTFSKDQKCYSFLWWLVPSLYKLMLLQILSYQTFALYKWTFAQTSVQSA